MKIDGACHCGKLSYEAEIDPDKVGVCHCTDCQVLSGSAFSVFVGASAKTFNLRGQPKTYVKTAESGNKRVQAFCPDCGTRVYASELSDNPQTFNIRVGTIRQRASLAPKRQIWCRSAYGWLTELGSVEKIAKQ